ncbi:MAG: helix-turn-helix transcriptional regulator [Enterococcaceae bacterium]|jgi:transcriptional regulator with XRE-family HTH domain|nr:helix-turn-helix transcriptional regulator [Enterococcaceae bacterium]
MSIVSRIKDLAQEKKMTIAELERTVGISNGQIRKWDDRTPGIDKIQKVADYFDVSTDYLLGRTEKRRYYDLTKKDERDITKELEAMITDLKSSGAFAYSKETAEVDEQTHELLIASLENSLRIAKIEAKKRFTPKKYRDRD